MSDLCLYELQDNVWDEFNEIDDHIVPQPADDTGDKCAVQSGSHKKLRVEVDPTSSVDCAKKFIFLGKREERSQIITKRDKMLIQGQWRCPSDGAQGDTVKEDTCMVSNDSTLTDNCFMSGTSSGQCARDSIMGDQSMSVDNNLYDYNLSQISQSESSLNFFDNGDKESSDLYYGWPDIGNFEDVDKMFRSCDSTFGLGSLSNDADLGWFSPSTAIEGSENALRSSFKISCSGSTFLRSDLENHRDYGPRRDDSSADESRKNFIGSYDSLRSHSTCIGEATSAENLQLVGEMKSESKEDSVPQEEMNLPRKQTELPNQLNKKKKEECQENAASLQRCSFSKPVLDAKSSHTDLSIQIPNFIAVDYHHQVSQISECPSLPSIKCVNDSHLSPRLKDSSPASNQAWSTDPHGNSFEVPSGKNDVTVRAYNNHQLQSSKAGGLNHLDTSPAAISDPVAVLKSMHRSVNDSEAGLSAGVATGLDNSLPQETSSMSSMVDEISLEATSFRQLQQVMEKLDIKTKLCIRDSLYRLARSAEQRHNCETPNTASNNEEARDGDIILDDSNKCNAFMDMETDTNPIDRSVAHLLFHRPKDQTAMPGNEPVSPKTNATGLFNSLFTVDYLLKN